MGKGWWPLRKVRSYFCYSRNTVYELVRRGEFEVIKGVGSQGMRISVESIERFIERHKVQPEKNEAE